MEPASQPAVIAGSFPTPNVVTDKLMHLLTPQENMVLQFMCRHIFGFQDTRESRKKRISLSVFVDGFTCIQDSGEVDYYFGTGLPLSTVRTVLKSLVQYRVISKCLLPDGTPDVDARGQLWHLPFNDVDFDGLKTRLEGIAARKSKQTAKALKARGVMSNITPDVGHKEGGNVPHKGGGYVGHTPYKASKKQVTKQENLSPSGDGAAASPSRQDKPRKPAAVKKPRERNPLFDAVVTYLFEVDLTDAVKVKGLASRIAQLLKNFPAKPEDLTPENLRQFNAWWRTSHPGLNVPCGTASLVKPWSDFEKVLENRRKFAAQNTTFPVARIAPVLLDGQSGMHQTIPDSELAKLRPDWRAAK